MTSSKLDGSLGTRKCAQSPTLALANLRQRSEDGKNRAFYKQQTGSQEKRRKPCKKGCGEGCDTGYRDGKIAKGTWIVWTMSSESDIQTNAQYIGNEKVSIQGMVEGEDYDCAG